MKKTWPNSMSIEDITIFLGIPHATKFKNIKFINEQFINSQLSMAEMLEEIGINVNKDMAELEYNQDEYNRRWIAIGMLLGQLNYTIHVTKDDISKLFNFENENL